MYDPMVAETFWPPSLQRRLLRRIVIAPGDRTLDVGCGTGQTTALVAERARETVGVDHSNEQLARASRKDIDADLLRADATHLPFPGDNFDTVVSVGAILYFPDPVAALAELRRVTRPGGRALVAGFNRTQFPSWVPVENWATPVNEALFATWTDSEAREQFATAGWEAIETAVTGPAWHPRLVRVVTARST
jgi:demethylmenaquinone methyltransferase/2-methoxy-6-polyprenyl-1,4-benzoquinol methylase